jgi:shikimate dehydrogenase
MKISGHTKVIAIFGDPVEHTLSPAMHNAAFAALGLDCVYVPFHVRPNGLKDAVLGLRAMGLKGANITVPHKERVVEFLDELDDEAKLLGAVNTIVNRDGVLKGFNTDGRGFVKSLKDDAKFDPKEKKVFICGSGGAARGIAFALIKAGAGTVSLYDVDGPKRDKLVQDLNTSLGKDAARAMPLDQDFIRSCELIVNATPLGMQGGDPLPIPAGAFGKGQFFCDIVYNPPKTAVMTAAEKAGAKVSNGLGMLLYQGVIAFEHWLGVLPPVEVMREALEKGLKVKKI